MMNWIRLAIGSDQAFFRIIDEYNNKSNLQEET
jgi:hypothetical protein